MSLETGTIRAHRIWKRFRPDRKRNPVVETASLVRDRLGGKPVDWQWALRDVDFRVEPGQALGLIGNNGSGKSTLLKILTRVMYPYAGRVEVEGRVGALIEVKAGIHPELSGRENVYLYGTLLGLSREQIGKRFDEIVAFSQLEESIDRQVKFYSSGMQMRLGFGVAAFLEPDVLLVDEVLAVGDQAFQQRCLDRMRTVLSQGTTLVYVSHDLPTVESICSDGMWLDQGVIRALGSIESVMPAYRRSVEEAAEKLEHDDIVRLLNVHIACNGSELTAARTQEPLRVRFEVETQEATLASVYLGISEGTAHPVFVVMDQVELANGKTSITCDLPRLPLPQGRFFIWTGMGHQGRELMAWRPAGSFDVIGPSLVRPPKAVVRPTPVHAEAIWAAEPL